MLLYNFDLLPLNKSVFLKLKNYKQTQSIQQQMITTVPYQMAYLTKSSFHLGEELSAKKKKQQPLIPTQIQTLVGKVQSFVDDINHKITNRIQLVQQVYLDDYKEQVFQMSNQLRNIRAMLDSQIIKQRANQKMFYLEEERDFFRSQVVKLNIQVNKLTQQNGNLKKKYEQEKSECQNYRKIVYNLETKLLKMRNLDIQSNNYNKNNMIKQTKISEMETLGSKTVLTTTRYNKSSINNQEDDQNQNIQKMAKTTGRLRPSQSMKTYNNKFTTSTNMGPGLNSYQKTFFTKTKLQRPEGYDQILQKQQIIDDCMNQIKKQIYYRNLSIKEKESKTLHFNINQQVPFQKFTKTDKKELIIKILSRQKMLEQFYEYLFSKKRSQDESIKLKTMKSKITDARFNTKMLSELKTQFNKKIFDIKHNQ